MQTTLLRPTKQELRSEFTADTRPDLPDTELWSKLFQRINVKGFPADMFQFHAYEHLRVVRTTGTMLVYSHHTNYALKPLTDKKNWESMDFFTEMKEKHLTPYLPLINEWLTLLNPS